MSRTEYSVIMIQESILQNIICCTHSAYPELECGIPAILTYKGTACIVEPPMQVLTSPSYLLPASRLAQQCLLELNDFSDPYGCPMSPTLSDFQSHSSILLWQAAHKCYQSIEIFKHERKVWQLT